jgi:glycosyltransferase involved in cell wall biosynthesis
MDTISARAVEDLETRIATHFNTQVAPIPWLVIGMGSRTYGKERRAVTALKHMPRIKPYFLTSQWEDGTVSGLLRRNGFNFPPVSVGYLGRARLRWTLTNMRLMPRLFWTVLRKYREQNCRGVLVLALQPFANVLPALWLLKFFSNARIVFYLGDIPVSTGANRALCRLMRWMADAIIVNSEAVRRGFELLGVPAGRINVVYNGLELERFNNVRPFPWREQFGWSDEALLVGYAGQFAENKGVRDFVSAAEEVLQQTDRFRFVFIGQKDEANPCYRELSAHICANSLEQKIVFAGWVPDMERAYAALDIMVVPSRHEEAASNAIIEAQASGLPVIATRRGGLPGIDG